MSQRLWYIKQCRLFESLSPEELGRLERSARMKTFPRDNVIYLPADAAEGVLLLAEGRVKLCSFTPDGKEAILAFIEPGELFGELAIVDQGQRDECAKTLVSSTVVYLPKDSVQELMANSPQLSLGITKLIGLRRRRIERRLKSLLYRSNRERLADLLLELAEQYGHRTPDGILIDLRLSHQELASVIGSTRESVTLLLGQLQLEGLIRVGRRRIVIRDLPRLAQLSELPASHGSESEDAAGHSPGSSPRRQQIKPLRQEM